MTYRVLFDYGDIEVTIIIGTDEKEEEKIQLEAIDVLVQRDFGLPPEQAMVTVEPAPEWEEE